MSTPDAGTSGYLNHSPTALERSKAAEIARTGTPAAQDDPVRTIDGNANNAAERTQRTTTDGKPVVIDPLESTRDVSIARERTLADAGGGRQYVSSDQLVFTTGAGNDNVRVTANDDGTLDVDVNGERWQVELAPDQELTLRTGAGNDAIDIAADVRVNLVVDAGHGDNTVATGGADAKVFGGDGEDTVTLGSGDNYVETRGGADEVSGGSGYNVVYGGDGDDVLAAGSGGSFINAGEGDNTLRAGSGNDVLIGGSGDDRIDVGHAADVGVQRGDTLTAMARQNGVSLAELLRANPGLANPDLIHPGDRIALPAFGGGSDRIYAGGGDDTVVRAGASDVVYAERGDNVSGEGMRVVNVEIDPALGQSIRIEGSAEFRERVAADIEFLRASPNGQQMLAQLDGAAAAGNSVTLRELQNEDNGFATESTPGSWADTQIDGGRAGAGGDTDIVYNTSFSDPDIFPSPAVVLYHEMSHAYNAVTGTFQPGVYNGPDVVDHGVPNAERQAVGLESSATPFDFDGDPRTPASTTNPFELTENGIREELGLPRRPSYAL